MAQGVEPERGAGSVTFEVERFEPRGRGQLALSGRWFGLRGRGFVRPTLTLRNGADRQRSLADLEHKPWAAQDGELWEATFPYEAAGARPRHIELTVAPDITVALPLPGSGASDQRIRARPRRDDLLDNLRGARRDGRPAPGSRNGSDPSRGVRSATRREDGLEAQREAPRVPAAPVTAPEPAVADAMARRDAAVGRLAEAISQRDKAARAYEQAVRARDHATRELDRMRKERDRMAKERDQALRDRDRAIAKASEAAAARAEHRPGAGAHPAVAGTRAIASPAVIWAQRVLAVSVLVIVVLAFAITARVL
jgi:hypothetical protein